MSRFREAPQFKRGSLNDHLKQWEADNKLRHWRKSDAQHVGEIAPAHSGEGPEIVVFVASTADTKNVANGRAVVEEGTLPDPYTKPEEPIKSKA